MTELICDACGTPFTTERAYGAHARNGRACRTRQHAYTASIKDLEQIRGDESIDLAEAGIEIVYGPTSRPRPEPSASGSSPYAPRWVVAVYRSLRAVDIEATPAMARLLRALAANDEDRDALMTIASLGTIDGTMKRSVLEMLAVLGYLNPATFGEWSDVE